MKKKGLLLGFMKGIGNKSGKPYCMLHVAFPYEEKQLAKGACGSNAEEIFCPAEQIDYIQPGDVNKEIEISYNVSGGRLFVDEITVIRK